MDPRASLLHVCGFAPPSCYIKAPNPTSAPSSFCSREKKIDLYQTNVQFPHPVFLVIFLIVFLSISSHPTSSLRTHRHGTTADRTSSTAPLRRWNQSCRFPFLSPNIPSPSSKMESRRFPGLRNQGGEGLRVRTEVRPPLQKMHKTNSERRGISSSLDGSKQKGYQCYFYSQSLMVDASTAAGDISCNIKGCLLTGGLMHGVTDIRRPYSYSVELRMTLVYRVDLLVIVAHDKDSMTGQHISISHCPSSNLKPSVLPSSGSINTPLVLLADQERNQFLNMTRRVWCSPFAYVPPPFPSFRFPPPHNKIPSYTQPSVLFSSPSSVVAVSTPSEVVVAVAACWCLGPLFPPQLCLVSFAFSKGKFSTLGPPWCQLFVQGSLFCIPPNNCFFHI